MEVLKSVWLKIVAGLTAVVGLLLYLISRKNKEVEELKTKVEMANTQKKADLIETEVKQKLDQVEMSKKEVEQHNKVLIDLEQKRKELKQKQNNMTPEEIEKYWNK